MWPWGKQEDNSYKLAQENIDLKRKLNEAEHEAKELREKFEAVKASGTKVPFEFDFKAMRAFSIERNFNKGEPCTVIGYLRDVSETHSEDNGYSRVITNAKVCEWYLYCDEANHKRLSTEFREYMESKK